MISFLIYLDTIALGAQAFIGLGFLVSSIWEREKRASYFAALQFTGMLLALIIFILFAQSGYFNTGSGTALLVLGTILSAGVLYFLIRRTEPNPKALQGARGQVVGDAK